MVKEKQCMPIVYVAESGSKRSSLTSVKIKKTKTCIEMNKKVAECTKVTQSQWLGMRVLIISSMSKRNYMNHKLLRLFMQLTSGKIINFDINFVSSLIILKNVMFYRLTYIVGGYCKVFLSNLH